MTSISVPSSPIVEKDGFMTGENVAFELNFPRENIVSSALFTLSIVSSEASFSLNCGSDELTRNIVSVLRTHLESCSVTLDGSSASYQKQSDQTITAVQNLAKKWLDAYSEVEAQTTLPKAPARVHTRGQSSGCASLASIRSGSTMRSRPSIMALPSPSTLTLASISDSPLVLYCQLNGEDASARLFVEYDEQMLLNEALLARLAASEWEYRSEVQKMPLTPPFTPTSPTTPNTAVGTPMSFKEKSDYFPEMAFEESGETKTKTKAPWWKFFGAREPIYEAKVITASDGSRIVLPEPPRDHEKFLYVNSQRHLLYVFGFFSFLSISAGMWLYVIRDRRSWWYGAVVGLIEIYFLISYFVALFGKDFDLKKHQEILDNNPLLSDAPTVDILLPSCGEPIEVLENTYTYISKLDYPNLKVYVLDDADLPSVKQLAAKYNFNYFCRDNRPYLRKAGNLRWSFTRTTGDFFVIYDADFCPRADFLRMTIPYVLNDPNIAIVQTPQYFRPCKEQTWVEQGAGSIQELFYRLVEVNRDRWGASICVGSNAVYRRKALEATGGTAEIGFSEDVHTGFYAVTRGWTLKYIPVALACGVCPDNPKAFFSQQMRWCSGSTALLTNPDFWKSNLSLIQKICFLSGFFYYASCAINIFAVPLPSLFMIWWRPDYVYFYNCFWVVPSIIYTTCIFRLWSRQRYGFNVQFIMVIQFYAYFMAIKDRLFNTTAQWVPSGNVDGVKDNKEKKGNSALKYRNMRILCAILEFGVFFGLVSGFIVRVLQGHHWYNFMPSLLLNSFQLFISLPFIFLT